MENEKSEPDPLNIEELIRQAEAQKKAWRLPKPDEANRGSKKPWQRLMDERIFKGPG
uniref:Uncharacterized protein n=1 Tax=viral metagenome TaxID=1070528 RepID=A0A6H2A1K8_9ZZZZ